MKQNSNKNRLNGRHSRFGNNRRSGNNITRNTVFDSTSPAGRIRGIASQLVEKYTSLAKDAKNQDDRILSETYLQYADHYVRMLEIATMNDTSRQQIPVANVVEVEAALPESATAEEAAAVQQEHADSTDCGSNDDRQVAGPEAATSTNHCEAIAQGDEQAQKQVQRRARRTNAHVKPTVTDCAPVVEAVAAQEENN